MTTPQAISGGSSMSTITNPTTGERYDIDPLTYNAARKAAAAWLEADAVVIRKREELAGAEAALARLKSATLVLVEVDRPIPLGNGMSLVRFLGKNLSREVKQMALASLGEKVPVNLRPWAPATIDVTKLTPEQLAVAKVGKAKWPTVKEIEDAAYQLESAGIDYRALLTEPGRAPDEVALMPVEDA